MKLFKINQNIKPTDYEKDNNTLPIQEKLLKKIKWTSSGNKWKNTSEKIKKLLQKQPRSIT